MRRRLKGMLMAGKQYSLDSRMDLVSTLVSQARQDPAMPTIRDDSVEGVDTGESTQPMSAQVRRYQHRWGDIDRDQ